MASKFEATYDYVDESGKLLYQACRPDRGENPHAPKSLPRRPGGNGGWVGNHLVKNNFTKNIAAFFLRRKRRF